MKKRIIIIISVAIVVGIMSFILIFMKKDEPVDFTQDEIKFKDEYEKLNGLEVFENYYLKVVDIISDNNVVYLNDKDVMDKLTSGTNVIYFGWSDCNWCRSLVPTLIDTLKLNEIDKLYYYDLKELRNAYEKSEEKDKVKLYEDILAIVGEDITTTFNEDSNKAGEKKILAPTVVFIKDGEYVGIHIKTIDSQEKSTDELTSEQIKDMKDLLQTNINKIKLNVCDSNSEGC